MFTVAERDGLRAALITAAEADPRISGVALTGSASVGREDRWSDIDLAFAPEAEFGAIAPTFRLLSGQAVPRVAAVPPDAGELIGLAWLYALHARSSIARGRGWQAEYMISNVRDHVLALACLRHGLPAWEGRGLHQLPPEVTGPLAGALVRSLDGDELARAFGVVTAALIAEVGHVDAGLAGRLAGPLRELCRTGA